MMKVSWFSTGISSFVATYLMRKSIDKIIYIHIDNQHPDSIRFVKDCEKLLQKPIEILQSRYKSVENVIQQFNIIRTPHFAKCTEVLKKRVRKEWESMQNEDIEYVWGFDCKEIERKERILDEMDNFGHHFPLIDLSIDKKDAHGIARNLELKRPAMYDLGYNNNNCIGCVRGGHGLLEQN